MLEVKPVDHCEGEDVGDLSKEGEYCKFTEVLDKGQQEERREEN